MYASKPAAFSALTWATAFALDEKLPAGMVKSIVGHSESMDTFGVYGHALTGDDEATTAALEDAFRSVLG